MVVNTLDEVVYNDIKYTVINKGSIMLINGKLYDQLDRSLPEINRKILGHYIRKRYNLSQKEYYGLIVNLDPLYKPTCPICGKDVSFRGLTKGFYDTTCSKSHAQSLAARNGTHHFIKEFGSMGECSKIITRKRVKEGTHQFQDYKNRAKNHRSVFINKGNPDDVCNFYITEVPDSDLIKIGVTNDIKSRSFMNNISGFEYTNTEIIFTSDRISIADLEMEVKIDLHHLAVEGLEYFDKTNKAQIIDYIKSKFND